MRRPDRRKTSAYGRRTEMLADHSLLIIPFVVGFFSDHSDHILVKRHLRSAKSGNIPTTFPELIFCGRQNQIKPPTTFPQIILLRSEQPSQTHLPPRPLKKRRTWAPLLIHLYTYLFLNSAFLFSRKAFMPSFWSSVAKHLEKYLFSMAIPFSRSRSMP